MVEEIGIDHPSTAASSKRVLSVALADAMRNDLVARNVAQLARPVKKARRKELRLQPEQIRDYVAAVIDHPKADLYLFYLYTGVRRGEACALRWCDLNLDTDPPTARIEHSYALTRAGYAITRTKTEKSRRTISLAPELADRLRAHKKNVLENRYFDANANIDDEFVFATPSGAPPRPDTVTKDINRLLAEHGINGIGPHQLRHLIASMLIARWGNTAAISQFLGHSNIRTTVDIYGHHLTSNLQQVANEISLAIEDAHATPST
jgi:integrase